MSEVTEKDKRRYVRTARYLVSQTVVAATVVPKTKEQFLADVAAYQANLRRILEQHEA